jgi:hypothetical protein
MRSLTLSGCGSGVLSGGAFSHRTHDATLVHQVDEISASGREKQHY